jgi:hypothetical protein
MFKLVRLAVIIIPIIRQLMKLRQQYRSTQTSR